MYDAGIRVEGYETVGGKPCPGCSSTLVYLAAMTRYGDPEDTLKGINANGDGDRLEVIGDEQGRILEIILSGNCKIHPYFRVSLVLSPAPLYSEHILSAVTESYNSGTA
jgi:hypothetical protein